MCVNCAAAIASRLAPVPGSELVVGAKLARFQGLSCRGSKACSIPGADMLWEQSLLAMAVSDLQDSRECTRSTVGAGLPAMIMGPAIGFVGVHIHYSGDGFYWFRSYSESLGNAYAARHQVTKCSCP